MHHFVDPLARSLLRFRGFQAKLDKSPDDARSRRFFLCREAIEGHDRLVLQPNAYHPISSGGRAASPFLFNGY